MTPHTPAEETIALDNADEPREDWLQDDEPDELPRRPRRKLLSPVPVTLLVLLLTACGFFAGVEVEKSNTSSASSGGGGGLAAGLAALRSRGGGTGASSSSRSSGAGGFSGAGGGFAAGGLTTGEVSYVSGDTLYVTDSEGSTIKVKAPAGTTVSKTVSTSVRSVHPGETVVVRGSTAKNGSVTASSISVASSSGSGSSSSSSASSTTPQLFGAG